MKFIRGELHIHSILSPCASRESTPRAILRECKAAGIKIAALTDHNSGENVAAFLELAPEYGVTAVPGMEMETQEGVHILSYFPDLKTLLQWQARVYSSLPLKALDPVPGPKELVGADGEKVKKKIDRALESPTSIPLVEAVNLIHSLGGIAIPAHIDRPYRSLLSQLGSIPNIGLHALEITRSCNIAELKKRILGIKDFPVIRGGDAHHPKEILGATSFKLCEPSFYEIKNAIVSKGSKKIDPGGCNTVL